MPNSESSQTSTVVLNEQVSQETSPLSEQAKQYRHDGVRAMMWLSADMKQWITQYGTTEEQVQQQVQEQPILAKIKEYNTLLNLFSSMLNIDSLSKDARDQVLFEWAEFKTSMRKSPKQEYFNIYQTLPEEDAIDTEDFINELKAFKHDLMSPTGGLGLLSEYQMIMTDPDLAPIAESATKLNFRFSHVREMLRGILDNQATKRSKMPPEALASIVIKMNEVLYAFNLESGGEISGDVPTSTAWKYLENSIIEIGNMHPGVKITKENLVNPLDQTKEAPLNQSIIFRLLLNTVSNSAKSNPEAEVSVVLSSTGESLLVIVKDNGSGFPSETEASRIILGNPVKLYQVAEGKTQWKAAEGTGSGLFGLSNLARKIGGELVTGNYYQGEEKLGALIALVAPLRAVK